MPIFYECQRCTACCRWPGEVRITESEITAMSTLLELSENEFIQGYTRIHSSRTGLALKDRPDGSCIFLNGGDCAVQRAKPQQCRDFPNLWNFPGFEQTCRARPVNMSREEWIQKVSEATGRDRSSVQTAAGVQEIRNAGTRD